MITVVHNRDKLTETSLFLHYSSNTTPIINHPSTIKYSKQHAILNTVTISMI